MNLAAFFSEFTSTTTQGVWIGIAVGIGVLFFFSRRRGPSTPTDPPIVLLNQKLAGPAARESSDYWNDPKLHADVRRVAVRREGNPTPIELASLDGKQRQPAVVLDRNSTGLRIA